MTPTEDLQAQISKVEEQLAHPGKDPLRNDPAKVAGAREHLGQLKARLHELESTSPQHPHGRSPEPARAAQTPDMAGRADANLNPPRETFPHDDATGSNVQGSSRR
jgi:hypothetical protein